MIDCDAKITYSELVKVLTTLTIHTGRNSWGGPQHQAPATYPESLANDLFRRAEKLREPKYQDEEVWQDARDGVFMRIGGGWFAIGSDRFWPDDHPVRPLRRLVPDGPLMAEWEKDLLAT